MTSRSYATAHAFKAAVEQRLRRDASAAGMDLHRRRQLFVFDRCLARIFAVLKDSAVFKGGWSSSYAWSRLEPRKTLICV